MSERHGPENADLCQDDADTVDRRRLVLGALAAGAAGLGAATALGEPAAAANGNPVVLGASSTASATTAVTTTSGTGLTGKSSASSSAIGVRGASISTASGTGVYGTATKGNGVRGVATTKGAGVRGETADSTNAGVVGINAGLGTGVHGTGATGVRAEGTNYGVYGTGSVGVRGISADANDGYGVYGENTASDTTAVGVYGTTANGTGVLGVSEGGFGVSGSSSASGGRGVNGSCTSGDGLHGESSDGNGVFGQAVDGVGVFGSATDALGVGVYGVSGSTGYAVLSQGKAKVTGDLEVGGMLTKGSGTFKIDHPVDPANKYLSHSFVESPDMMNIYNGNVTLDRKGRATVTMPDWFDALNKDFRYQLTALDGAAPRLHVSRRLQDGAFSIAGGKKGMDVSWQVTGVRQDAFANANRTPVEEDKPQGERGRYLHPELFDSDKSVHDVLLHKERVPAPAP